MPVEDYDYTYSGIIAALLDTHGPVENKTVDDYNHSYKGIIEAILDTAGGGGSGGGGSGDGTVTSVRVTPPASIMSATGNPITTAGTISLSLIAQGARTFFAGPDAGSAATPSFRTIADTDIPGTIARTAWVLEQINSAIAAINQEFLLNRTNHTGTQTASTISDLQEAIDDRVATLLQAGTNITLDYNDVANTLTISAAAGGGGGGSGTVTSVGLSAPSIFSVTGSPVTASGTLALTLASQTTATFFAAPAGANGTPVFRAIQVSDLPSGMATDAEVAAAIDAHELTRDHPLATTSLPGLMSATDKTKLDGLSNSTSSLTDFNESVDDRVAALLVAGANITLTYNDAANTLTIAAAGGGGGGGSKEVLNVSAGFQVSSTQLNRHVVGSNNVANIVVTVPTDATDNLAIGSELDLTQEGLAYVVISPQSSTVKVRTFGIASEVDMRINGRRKRVTLKKIAANEWRVYGDMMIHGAGDAIPIWDDSTLHPAVTDWINRSEAIGGSGIVSTAIPWVDEYVKGCIADGYWYKLELNGLILPFAPNNASSPGAIQAITTALIRPSDWAATDEAVGFFNGNNYSLATGIDPAAAGGASTPYINLTYPLARYSNSGIYVAIYSRQNRLGDGVSSGYNSAIFGSGVNGGEFTWVLSERVTSPTRDILSFGRGVAGTPGLYQTTNAPNTAGCFGLSSNNSSFVIWRNRIAIFDGTAGSISSLGTNRTTDSAFLLRTNYGSESFRTQDNRNISFFCVCPSTFTEAENAMHTNRIQRLQERLSRGITLT